MRSKAGEANGGGGGGGEIAYLKNGIVVFGVFSVFTRVALLKALVKDLPSSVTSTYILCKIYLAMFYVLHNIFLSLMQCQSISVAITRTWNHEFTDAIS